MGTSSTLTGSRSEHRGISYWMERTLKELEKVRSSPDPDAVHDLRVAIRRCRSVAAVLEEVDPDLAWPELRRLGKKLFRQLGELRDTQVLAEWVQKLSGADDAIGQKLQAAFATKEVALREAALKCAGKFDSKNWKKLERTVRRRSRLLPLDGLAAECLAIERWDAAKELHSRALRSEKPEAWHELRIGVKRFRYTVESLLPTRYETWGEDLKRLQDLLGDAHDLDVLAEKIAGVATGASPESLAAWDERIFSHRNERIETYKQWTLGKTNLWQVWRDQLPQGHRLDAAGLARLRVTARALGCNLPRIAQVSRLAMRLYDSLSRAHASPILAGRSQRKIMRAATRLHAIGVPLNPEKPQKAARKFLLDLPMPPGWNELEWIVLANVIRYHRGSAPNSDSKSFMRLDADQRHTIGLLAGILRLARVLRKCGVESAAGVRVERSVDAIIVRVPGLKDSAEIAARLAAGKHALETQLEHPLILKSVPVPSKVVELPRNEPAGQQSAAASD